MLLVPGRARPLRFTQKFKEYVIWTGNKALLDSCQELSGIDNLLEDDASAVIIRELWKKLR